MFDSVLYNFRHDEILTMPKVSTMASRVRASHVLIKHTGSRNPISRRTGETITLSPTDADAELRQLETTLRNSNDLGMAVRQAAEQRSDCGSFRNGGDLGEFGSGEMQEAFETAAFALQPGEMSSVVSTDSGYHLIYRIS